MYDNVLFIKIQIFNYEPYFLLQNKNSYMPFLRNEFSKVFEDLFTIALFRKMTHIYDQMKN